MPRSGAQAARLLCSEELRRASGGELPEEVGGGDVCFGEKVDGNLLGMFFFLGLLVVFCFYRFFLSFSVFRSVSFGFLVFFVALGV